MRWLVVWASAPAGEAPAGHRPRPAARVRGSRSRHRRCRRPSSPRQRVTGPRDHERGPGHRLFIHNPPVTGPVTASWKRPTADRREHHAARSARETRTARHERHRIRSSTASSSQLPDTDPGETAEWLDSLDAVVDAHGKTRARFLVSQAHRAGPRAAGRHARRGVDALRQHHPRRGAALVPRRRGHRAPHPRLHPLERRRHGRQGQQARRRHRRPPLHRSPPPPRSTRSASTTSSGARTTAWPATTSTSRATPPPASTPGPSSRAASTRTSSTTSAARSAATACRQLPPPAAHARLLGVPDGVDGPRPAQLDLPGPVQPLPRTTASSTTPASSRVWCFVGDGECDEPETLGSISLAAREGLDNLTWVVNCNLQRLDGPVRGNGKIIQELEAVFRGAGWNVIKVDLGRAAGTSCWPATSTACCWQQDEHHRRRRVPALRRRVRAPTSASTSSGPTPACASWSSTCPTSELRNLPRGGHDYRKLYAAYKAATEQTAAPRR